VAEKHLSVPDGLQGTRLDVFLAEMLDDASRSLVKKYIKEEVISVNGVVTVKPSRKLEADDLVRIAFPPPKETGLVPVPMDLDILFEDKHILVLNKRPGITVHPSPGHENDTIVNGLLHYFGESGDLSRIGGVFRPGIVHRLDKDTSGVLIIAKNDRAHENLSSQFENRKIEKIYEALVKGGVRPPSGTIDSPLGRSPRHRKKFTVVEGGRRALTYYETVACRNNSTWVKLFPKTGRTHQLRVHMASIGHPIIGDSLYARGPRAGYMALVAKRVTIVHPAEKKTMTFEAPYPDHFLKIARELGYEVAE